MPLEPDGALAQERGRLCCRRLVSVARGVWCVGNDDDLKRKEGRIAGMIRPTRQKDLAMEDKTDMDCANDFLTPKLRIWGRSNGVKRAIWSTSRDVMPLCPKNLDQNGDEAAWTLAHRLKTATMRKCGPERWTKLKNLIISDARKEAKILLGMADGGRLLWQESHWRDPTESCAGRKTFQRVCAVRRAPSKRRRRI